MTIFYDHQIFSLQTFGGASRLFAELVSEIKGKSAYKAIIGALSSNNVYLKEKNLHVPAFFPGITNPKKAAALYKLNDWYSPVVMRLSNYQLYHPTYYDTKMLKYAGDKPVVATFLDMIHERFVDRYPEIKKDEKIIAKKKQMAESATHLIAISESTKHDMINMYGLDPAKISVVYLGSSFDHTLAEKEKSVDPYILYVGTRGAYKNFKPMLKAIAEILRTEGIELVCAGGPAFTTAELEFFGQLKLTKNVRHESVDDRKLATLYSNALAFIFPSLYEGFGIPILEAFACKVPCLVSNTSSLPEVGGEACFYMDSENEASIRHAVTTIIHDETLRQSLVEKGIRRLGDFSWKKQAEETLKVYESLL